MMLWKRFVSGNIKKSRTKIQHDRKKLFSKAKGIDCSDGIVLGKRKARYRRVDSNNNNNVRKKQKISGNYGGFDRNGEIDRISELPESIIHHIFTFLSCIKDVARTTVLSKNWKSMFNSYHSFDFDERWFRVRRGKGKHNRIKARELQKKKFQRYVDKSIATRLESLPSIDKFRLCVNNVNCSMATCIAHWIRAAIDKNVKELDLQVRRDGIFVLPKNVVDSSSLISLKLSGSMWYNFYALKLCNLRELSIKDCRLFNVMEKFDESCPLLEDLRLICCPELLRIVISSLVKLRRVEVQDCALLNRIEIAGSNHLESFWYHAKKNQRCEIDLRNTENLKNLTWKDRMITDSAFEDWIFKCPLLEKLVIQECSKLEKVKIFSGKLRSLGIIKCVRLCEVNIDAPNLHYLEYNGHMMPFSFTNASRLWQGKFSFSPRRKRQSQCTFRNQDFFRNLDGLNSFKLIVHSKLNMKIFEESSEATLAKHNFEKLELTESSASAVKIVDNWLRECHGKSLTLISSDSELVKLISRMIVDREDHPSCCRYYSNKCWRHYIVDAKVSTLKFAIGKEETCYDLTWRSRKS